ncbi:uncharacterized protein TNCT_267791 [Trichonephila clavata]|uniref:DUF5641 domain-containing protein n=1 Tax=Trichonephila clavata TaxID=2740835 RepID=A0A8X6KBD8_TRICU|nr:uncharacterized protein TNCT_267791 [Trichonephila clavata]
MSSNKSHHAQGQNQIGNDTNPNKTVTASVNSEQTYFSLLPTIRVNIKNILGENCQVRVMTDSGSESTFISEKCLKLLGLKRKNPRLQIRGLQDSNIAMTKGCDEMDLVSLHDPKVNYQLKRKLTESLNSNSMLNLHINGTSIDNQLKQFWELEEIPNLKDRILTSEEQWVILTADNTVELHGFADASSLAYAAAIYCRQKHNGKIKVQLLVSKTKVAPVKQVSIPRLELCGAHFLSKLFKSILCTLKHYTFDVFAWTDSKIVLSWLSSHPRKWKTFVANRTSEIMEVLPTKHWRHEPSKGNPADIASRGIDPKYLPDCMLWWQGPLWLRLETFSWLKTESSFDEASDGVKVEQKSDSIFNLFTHTLNDIGSSHNNTTPLTFLETKTAEETVIRCVQGTHFQEEIQNIKKQTSLPPKSPLRSLHPFIDEHGLVRVMSFSQFLKSFLPLPTTEISGSVLLQNIKRGFWKKWSSDFLSSLQPRKKWQVSQPNLKEDDIVVIKEEGPPGKWPMARVLQVHPGNDGLVRVATVKTQDSIYKRPVHKL